MSSITRSTSTFSTVRRFPPIPVFARRLASPGRVPALDLVVGAEIKSFDLISFSIERHTQTSARRIEPGSKVIQVPISNPCKSWQAR